MPENINFDKRVNQIWELESLGFLIMTIGYLCEIPLINTGIIFVWLGFLYGIYSYVTTAVKEYRCGNIKTLDRAITGIISILILTTCFTIIWLKI